MVNTGTKKSFPFGLLIIAGLFVFMVIGTINDYRAGHEIIIDLFILLYLGSLFLVGRHYLNVGRAGF